MTLVIDQIKHASHAYDEAVDLRRQILRAPLGLDFTPEELQAEADYIHIAAYMDGFLAGTCILIEKGDDAFQLRQMAVLEAYEGQKVGKTLLRHAERVARARGRNRIDLNARVSAQPFYTKNGYVAEGDVFTDLTLPHIRMSKSLT